MAKNKDGLEAGAPVSFEELSRLERADRRAKLDVAAKPVVEPTKPAPKKRRVSEPKEGSK